MGTEYSPTQAERIKLKGADLGFSHVGIIPCHDFDAYAQEVKERPAYARFVQNPASFVAGCYPSTYFPQGRSVICATYGFGHTSFPNLLTPYLGRIYLSRCYVPKPDMMAAKRVAAMTEFLRSLGMEVYDGPIEFPARPAAVEAGIATYGNNNFIFTEEDGSFVVAYTWLVDGELDHDEPHDPINLCPPDCNLCMKACPTGAIVKPRTLDCTRCVLLNDLMVPMNPEVANDIGTRIHGCDACQEVCPRNHHVLHGATAKDPFLEAIAPQFDLERILFLESFDDDYYRDILRPVMYNYITNVDVLRRNAAVAMGNSGEARYIPALQRAATQYSGLPSGEAAVHGLERLRSL